MKILRRVEIPHAPDRSGLRVADHLFRRIERGVAIEIARSLALLARASGVEAGVCMEKLTEAMPD